MINIFGTSKIQVFNGEFHKMKKDIDANICTGRMDLEVKCHCRDRSGVRAAI